MVCQVRNIRECLGLKQAQLITHAHLELSLKDLATKGLIVLWEFEHVTVLIINKQVLVYRYTKIRSQGVSEVSGVLVH